MKHFMFILLALILTACASSKKTTRQESAKTETSSVVEETKASGNAIVIDTTKSNDFTYTITQIEFFPPSGNVPEIGEKCNCIPKTMQLHTLTMQLHQMKKRSRLPHMVRLRVGNKFKSV